MAETRRAETWDFDQNSLTPKEMEFIEDYTGLPIDDLMKDGVKKSKVLAAMIYIAGRRRNPDFTIEEAEETPVSVLETVPLEAAAPSNRAERREQLRSSKSRKQPA